MTILSNKEFLIIFRKRKKILQKLLQRLRQTNKLRILHKNKVEKHIHILHKYLADRYKIAISKKRKAFLLIFDRSK